MPCGHDVQTWAADSLEAYPAVSLEGLILPSGYSGRMDLLGQRGAVYSAASRPIRYSTLSMLLLLLHFATGGSLIKPNKAKTNAKRCLISSIQEQVLQRRRRL